jgi:hypothetical protein
MNAVLEKEFKIIFVLDQLIVQIQVLLAKHALQGSN